MGESELIMEEPVSDHERIVSALQTLGLEPTAPWEDVRSAYRSGLMSSHPDRDDSPDAAAETDRIVAAFRTLREATGDGAATVLSLFDPADAVGAPLVLDARHGDVFERLLEAMGTVGEISYIDRESGFLQTTVERAGFAASHLTVEITPLGIHSQALFTLETLGTGSPPDLADVVAEIGEQLKLPPRLGGRLN